MNPFANGFTLGVALPIFGVPLQQSVERSRCHDDTGLPLVVRDSIDYLQAHGLKSNQIYRTEPDRIKLQQLRKLFTDRGPTFPYHWDVPVACAILKYFISELPESILTQELHGQFEQATAIAEPQREITMVALIGKLPACNHSLVGWLMRHFENVVANEQWNHANIQTIMGAMGSVLNMSLNLLTYLVTKSEKLFPDVQLTKYVPPLPNIPADFPESAAEISLELRKQESLLNQIHAEMHAGFITPARDHQLWEAQRIVTMLKRKLRSVQKSTDPHNLSQQQTSIDEKQDDDISRRNSEANQTDTELKSPDAFQDKESPKVSEVPFEPTFPKAETAFEPTFPITEPAFEPAFPKTEPAFEPAFPITEPAFEPTFPKTEATFEPSFPKVADTFEPGFSNLPEASFEPSFTQLPKTEAPFEPNFDAEFEDNFDFKLNSKDTPDHETQPTEPIKEKPKFTEKELKILRLQLENAEYLQLKSLLQAKINSEQFEIVKLRSHIALKNKQENLQNKENKENVTSEDQELKQRLIKENSVLEQRRLNLINQIFQERVACIQLKIELAMKEILSKS